MAVRRRAVLLWAAVAAPLAWAPLALAAPSPAEQARIERLIAYVESRQQLHFVRNGKAYPPKDAAVFLRRKFAKMGEHVNNAQQFIEQIASKSSTSGEPYLIRFPDGRELPVARFLGDELKRMDR